MADSRYGAGNVYKMSLELLAISGRKEADLKKFPLTKDGTIWTSIRIIAVDWRFDGVHIWWDSKYHYIHTHTT